MVGIYVLIMTTLYNITEAKNKLAQIGKSLQKGNEAFFLKNGKVLFVAIAKDDYERYKQYEEQQRFNIWKKSLPQRKATDKEEVAFLEAEKERGLKKRKPMASNEIMESLL
jgi:hypothetical protein